jgi:hypothetical protein
VKASNLHIQRTMLHPSLPWKWRQHGPPKPWYSDTSLQGITIQKTATWTFTAVKTSNLPSQLYVEFHTPLVSNLDITCGLFPSVWSENLKGKGLSENQGVDERIIVEWILGKVCRKLWTGYFWALVNTQWTSRFHKRQGISSLAEWLLASQEGLCSVEIVNFNGQY